MCSQHSAVLRVFTFTEPEVAKLVNDQARTSFRAVLQQSAEVLRKCPALRFPLLYMALIMVASVILETLFVQPQALAFDVPVAAIGVIVLVLQVTSIAGSTWSRAISSRIGEERILVAVPALVTRSLLLLAALHVRSMLLCIAAVSFLTVVVSPILLHRLQNEVPDEIRATMLSVQSLFTSLFLAIAQPSLGALADHSGLPAAYLGLASVFAIGMAMLFWLRHHAVQRVEPQAVLSQTAAE